MRWIRLLERRVWRHPLVWFVASLSSVALLAACGTQSNAPNGDEGSQGSTTPVGAVSTDKSLRLLYWQAPTTLNPHLS
ncbi:MAG: hypothetical protein MJA27_31285, partial [Pseudanabaenales cyanobacterium]|nr:hypothetical protein [Pseudanabaenales cyanobacterium]